MIQLAVMDPMWNADDGGAGRGAQNHYGTASVDGIAQVIRMSPCWRDAGDALVFMWATTLAFHQGDAHAPANRLNLRVCAGFVWAKIDRLDRGHFEPPARMGLGQWTRCEHEHLLICRRGDVSVPTAAARQRSMIYAERGEHSAKPEQAWRVIEATAQGVLSAEGAFGKFSNPVEYFSRNRRQGWGAFGTLDGPNKPARFEPVPEGETWAT